MLTVDYDLLGVREGDLALDAGCGEGRHSFEFVRRGASVFPMDMDLPSIRKARFTLVHLRDSGQIRGGARFQIHSGDALNLPFRDCTFDRVICSEVMEHVSDDRKACREMARVLKKGATIAITVPTFFSELGYDILTYEYFTSPGGHIRKYFPKELAAIMESCGLQVYGIRFKHAFHTLWWVIRCVVGLHLADHPITKAYHRFLTLGLFSPLMRRAEKFFDWFFPKSVIIYAVKK